MGRPRKYPVGTEGAVIPEGKISVDRVSKPTLADPRFDPFAKFKTDPNFHYRAINTRAHNLRKREAEGYQTIGGSEFGDLVLAKIPKDIKQARDQQNEERSRKQIRSARENFKEEAARSKVEAFEDT